MSLLEVKNLRIEYPSRYGVLAAVKDLSFSIEKGEIVGVVGESGAGKSTIGNAVIDLLSPPGRIARGDIYLNGELISGKSQNEMRAIRGSRIGFIFQDPMTSLNPLFTVEHQLVETILANTDLSREAAFTKALELMGRWVFRSRSCASNSIRTSSPVACVSGWLSPSRSPAIRS